MQGALKRTFSSRQRGALSSFAQVALVIALLSEEVRRLEIPLTCGRLEIPLTCGAQFNKNGNGRSGNPDLAEEYSFPEEVGAP